MDAWKIILAALLCVGLMGCPRKHHGHATPPKCPLALVPAATQAPPLIA